MINKVTVNNWPKLLSLLLAMVIIGVLIWTGSIQETTGAPMLTLIVGYLVGNGIAARRGEIVEPTLGRKE